MLRKGYKLEDLFQQVKEQYCTTQMGDIWMHVICRYVLFNIYCTCKYFLNIVLPSPKDNNKEYFSQLRAALLSPENFAKKLRLLKSHVIFFFFRLETSFKI